MFRYKIENSWFVWLLVASLSVAFPVAAAEKEPRMQKVYMFGFGASLTDSLARQTQVQAIDSAWLDAHQLLVDRSLYSLQLQFFLEQNEGMKHPVCTIYFNTNERKLHKLWQKVRKRYVNEPTLRYAELADDKFRFMAEQYRPIVIGEDDEQPAVQATKTKDKKPKKKEKKK